MGIRPNGLEQASTKMNTNVSLTKFEERVLEKLTMLNGDGDVINEVTKDDIYGKNIFDKEIEGGTEKISFLAMKGAYKLENGKYANVTVVVVNDKRFYTSLAIYNKEAGANEGDSLFINGLYLQQNILSKLSNNFMSDEQIEEEVNALANFGA